MIQILEINKKKISDDAIINKLLEINFNISSFLSQQIQFDS